VTTETEQILSQIPIARLAAQLGTDDQTAQEAAEVALPTLLAGLTNEAQDPRRAPALAAAVQRDHDPATLAADDPLAAVDPDEGDRIVSHLFGADRGEVEARMQGAVGGASGSLVSRMLPLLAPLVMSWLAGKVRGGGSGRSGGGGLGDILGDVLGGAVSGGAPDQAVAGSATCWGACSAARRAAAVAGRAAAQVTSSASSGAGPAAVAASTICSGPSLVPVDRHRGRRPVRRTGPASPTSATSSAGEPGRQRRGQLHGNGDLLVGCSRPCSYRLNRNGSSRSWGSPSSSAATRSPTPIIL